jgi:hypothetical protein
MVRGKGFTRKWMVIVLAVGLVFGAGAVAASGTAASALATQPAFTPKISGTAAVGLVLNVTGRPSGTTLTYRWKRNGVPIHAATHSTYKVAKADAGTKLTVTVTSTRSGYTTRTVTSAPTKTVVKRFSAPAPKISGTARQGAKLTAKPGTWSPIPTFTYQWYRDGVAISGATKSTRTLAAADVGAKITVKVTGRKSGYLTATKTSAATSAVLAASAYPVGAGVDYQIGGAYTPPSGVSIVERDNADSPASGKWNVCYINGFQTQPGESGKFASDLILHNSSGKAVGDPDWPGEYLLDTSNTATRAGILAVLDGVIDTCASKGFDAVEFDNLDSYTRSGKLLTADNNIAMAKLFVAYAHSKGLWAAQKNTVELSQRLHDEAGFDFAIAEECVQWSECSGYTEVYGGKAFDVEYSDNSLSLSQVCASSQRMASTVYRDRDLVAKGSSGYVYGTCS